MCHSEPGSQEVLYASLILLETLPNLQGSLVEDKRHVTQVPSLLWSPANQLLDAEPPADGSRVKTDAWASLAEALGTT